MKKRVGISALAVVIVFSFLYLYGARGTSIAQVKITAVSQYGVKLMPGGKSVTVMIKGYYLDKITSVQALINGRPTQDVVAKLGGSDPSSRSLTLGAQSTAKPYCCVVIRAIAGGQYIDISQKQLRVEIVAPEPVSPPSAPSTPTSPETKIEISSVSTRYVKLIKGGDPVKVVIRGNNLDIISRVEVLLNGQITRDVETSLSSPSSTSRSIAFRAVSGSRALCCYLVRLITAQQVINVPSNQFRIEVVEPSAPAEVPEPTQPLPEPPKLISFTINNNAAETTQRRVRLNIVWDDATQYRASENQSFSGANWQSLTGYMYYELSSGSGNKTVYVQVRNSGGVTSELKQDSINLSLEPASPPSEPSTPTPADIKLEISSVSTNHVKLVRRGDPVSVTVKGKNLGNIKKVEVLLYGRTTRDVQTRLGSPSSTSRSLMLKAASHANARCCYEVRLIAEQEVINVPSQLFKIEIVESSAPVEIPETPQLVPEPTQPVPVPPKLISFTINNNAAETTQRRVRLNIVWVDATQYRASEDENFSGADWQSLTGYMYYELSSGSGNKTVYVQVRNSGGATTPAKSDSIMAKYGPVITSFKIINHYADNSISYSDIVKYYYWHLNAEIVATGNPTHFRYAEKSNLSDTQWRTLQISSSNRVDLIAQREGVGVRTVYIQVKNDEGESSIAHATFTIPSRREFQIDATKAREISEPYGFIFSSTAGDMGSQCSMESISNYIRLMIPFRAVGSRCDFTLFGGKTLNSGWVFKSYHATSSCEGPDCGYRVDERPSAGGRSVKFRIHLWANPWNECRYTLYYIKIEGPGDGVAIEAFK